MASDPPLLATLWVFVSALSLAGEEVFVLVFYHFVDYLLKDLKVG
jgi:hypothetical protein